MSYETLNDKTLYLIRHGESTFNEWRIRSILTCTWICIKDPMIIDAPLSEKGRIQVEELNEDLKKTNLNKKVELIISSPLTRALETTIGGFSSYDIPIYVEPLIREMRDTACDTGRQPEELNVVFRNYNIDFSHLKQDWWLLTNDDISTNEKETIEEVDNRIREVLTFIETRNEKDIAIVGHSSFFKRLTKASRKLRNCEIQSVSFQSLKSIWNMNN